MVITIPLAFFYKNNPLYDKVSCILAVTSSELFNVQISKQGNKKKKAEGGMGCCKPASL